MNAEEIDARRKEIIERRGPWTAHNICLGGDVYTIGREIVGDEVKLRRVVQTVSDVSGKPLDRLRVLDLACLEGLYAVEFARHGAEVVGIEGREANIEKARFAKEVLGLDRLELVQDDVRNLSEARHGRFDVVLCLGILYHLDAPDVFAFVEKISEVCRGFAVIDTHVAPAPETSRDWKGAACAGAVYREHDEDATPEEMAKCLWASLDNRESFWLTRASLYNALSRAGFTSVYECRVPPERKSADRVTLVAVKGDRRELLSAPLLNAVPVEDTAEDPGAQQAGPGRGSWISRSGARMRRLFRRLRRILHRMRS